MKMELRSQRTTEGSTSRWTIPTLSGSKDQQLELCTFCVCLCESAMAHSNNHGFGLNAPQVGHVYCTFNDVMIEEQQR